MEAMYGRSQSWTMLNFCLCLYFIYPRQSYATVEIHPYYRPVYAEVLNFYALDLFNLRPIFMEKSCPGYNGLPSQPSP